MTCSCNSSGSSTSAGKRAFSERALKLALSLPDDVTCKKNFTETEALFLSSLRNLAAEFSHAHTWSDSEARSRSQTLAFADAVFTYGYETGKAEQAKDTGGGGGGGGSCTARCVSEKDSCRSNCDADDDAGYFCYFDCRLAYFACLAGCVGHGIGGGGGGPVIA
jgi:hypothetical protein